MDNKTFSGSLGNYRWEETQDGSLTLFSEYFNENCHSTSGALEETLYNYIEGCKIDNFIQEKNAVHIFELGLGTALGLKTTLDHIQHSAKLSNVELLFTSCEIDKELAAYALNQLHRDGYISTPLWNESDQLFHGQFSDPLFNETSTFKILIGDIRKQFTPWLNSGHFKEIDAIYQDAFSPKQCPSLWTHQWFSDLALASHEDTIMSTYSSSKAVWKAMVEAGWKVQKVRGHGIKKLSTRAYQKGEMTQEFLELLHRSPTCALSDEA